MLPTLTSLQVRALAVLGLALLAGIGAPPASAAAVRLECEVTACDDTCSLIRCIGAAECAVSGSCDFDPACPGLHLRLTCDDIT